MKKLFRWLFPKQEPFAVFIITIEYFEGPTHCLYTENLTSAKTSADKWISDLKVRNIRVWKTDPKETDLNNLFNGKCVYHICRL